MQTDRIRHHIDNLTCSRHLINVPCINKNKNVYKYIHVNKSTFVQSDTINVAGKALYKLLYLSIACFIDCSAISLKVFIY